jgi:hypothetical protein
LEEKVMDRRKKDYELNCSFYTKLENLRDQINGGRWKLDVES